ncbi:RNA polymerase sigma factor [Paenibacillus elgii]|uniref:RNA polymerase sigma factor n=1 Tax=Paenibacillus elgii TaxID=189691 RepID=UPI000FD65753|nr:sigma-70 family RNA polymerase sigma factor [Paenibacillus elgii]NEN84067.1 sigma-70 family RNA polymerase sigma factor [Paenibacillus elgii]
MREEVIKAQKGDKEAFIGLIRRMEQRLYNVSRSILPNDEDCADAAQEAIVKAYKGLHALKDPNLFSTWLIRILINECNKIWNTKRKYVSGAAAEQSYIMEGYEEKLEIREAVEKLERPLKVVVVLYYFEDLPIKQIAEILELPEGTIKSRLNRARISLSQMFTNPLERNIDYGY